MFRSFIFLVGLVPSLTLALPNHSCYRDYYQQAEYQAGALTFGADVAAGMVKDAGPLGATLLVLGTVFGFTEVAALGLGSIDATTALSQRIYNAYLDLDSSLEVIKQAEQGILSSSELSKLTDEVNRHSGKTLTSSDVSERLKFLSVSRAICKNNSRTSSFRTYLQIVRKIGQL